MKLLNKNVAGYNTNLTQISWKNLQVIIGKISDEQDPVISNWKREITKEYEKNQLGAIQMIVREYDKQNKSIKKEKHRKIEIIYPPEGIQK